MDRVAVGADYIAECMRGSPDICPADLFGMTSQAIVQHFGWGELGKRNNRRFPAARLDVRLPRTMAALAPGSIRSLFSAGDGLIVRIFVEISPDIRMASAASVASYIGIGLGQ